MRLGVRLFSSIFLLFPLKTPNYLKEHFIKIAANAPATAFCNARVWASTPLLLVLPLSRSVLSLSWILLLFGTKIWTSYPSMHLKSWSLTHWIRSVSPSCHSRNSRPYAHWSQFPKYEPFYRWGDWRHPYQDESRQRPQICHERHGYPQTGGACGRGKTDKVLRIEDNASPRARQWSCLYAIDFFCERTQGGNTGAARHWVPVDPVRSVSLQ